MEALYQPGDIIQDKYRIVSILGEGGTAITYEAIDLTQEISVAIKVLSLQQTKDWKLVELFEREIKVLKNLNHSQIPQYLDSFSIDTKSDRIFILVQELIIGKSLADLVEQGWYFQEKEVKNIAQQVLEILTYLHSFQPPVIHRDIKPHNIIRTDTGEIYLVDLGAVQDIYRNTLTRGATFVGTIDYMSPEQLRGHASFASDLYSLGCTLLYLLTRRSPSELPLQRMKIDFRSSLNISEQFTEWLDIILEPVLEDRFSSTAEALNRLHRKKLIAPQPLLGSLIKIKRRSNSLLIYIPPQRKLNRRQTQLLAEVLLIGGGQIPFLKIASLGFLQTSNVLFWLWLLLVSISILYIPKAIDLAFALGGKIKLKIDPNKFHIVWNCCGVKKQISGDTKNIKAIAIKEEKYQNESILLSKECCMLQEGIREHLFGMWLSPAERQWLVTEITNFISEFYPHKYQID